MTPLLTVILLFSWLLAVIRQAYGQECTNFIQMTADTKAITKIFENVENLPNFWNNGCDICDWDSSSSYLYCENDALSWMDLSHLNLTGYLNIGQYSLPNGLRYLNLGHNDLTGTVSWGGLGLLLEYLDLGYNNFNGSIELHLLSDTTQYVYLSHNEFSGSFDLSEYNAESDSNNLQYVYITDNQLSGNIDFSLFPRSIDYFYAGSNNFDGIIDGSTFVKGMKQVYLGNNYFNETKNLDGLPNSMTHLYLTDNELSGSLNISGMKSLYNLQVLSFSKNNLQGTIDWQDLPANLTQLYLYSNMFDGTVDIDSLPNTLETIMIYDNSFNGNLELSKMPTQIDTFIADSNEFSGSLELDLPFASNMEHLWLFSNSFYTDNSVSFEELPDTLVSLLLGDNYLSGTVDFANAPDSFEYLFLDYNNISKGVDFISSLPSNSNIRLDIGVFCIQEFCDLYAVADCSIPAYRKRVTCHDYIDCLSTCQCAVCNTSTPAPTMKTSNYYAIHGSTNPNLTELVDIGDYGDTVDEIESASLKGYPITSSPTPLPTDAPTEAAGTLVEQAQDYFDNMSSTQRAIAVGGAIICLLFACICCCCCVKSCCCASNKNENDKETIGKQNELNAQQSSNQSLMSASGKTPSSPRDGPRSSVSGNTGGISPLPANATNVGRARSISSQSLGSIHENSPSVNNNNNNVQVLPPIGAPAMERMNSNASDHGSGARIGRRPHSHTGSDVELLQMRFTGSARGDLSSHLGAMGAHGQMDPRATFSSLQNMYQKMDNQLHSSDMGTSSMESYHNAAQQYQQMMATMLQYQNMLQTLRNQQFQQTYNQQIQLYQQKLVEMQNLLKQKALLEQQQNHNNALNESIVNQVNLMQKQVSMQQQQQQQQLDHLQMQQNVMMQHANTVRVMPNGHGQASIASIVSVAANPAYHQFSQSAVNMNPGNGQVGYDVAGGDSGGEGENEGGPGAEGVNANINNNNNNNNNDVSRKRVSARHNYSFGGNSDQFYALQQQQQRMDRVSAVKRNQNQNQYDNKHDAKTSPIQPVNTDDLVLDEFEDMYTSRGGIHGKSMSQRSHKSSYSKNVKPMSPGRGNGGQVDLSKFRKGNRADSNTDSGFARKKRTDTGGGPQEFGQTRRGDGAARGGATKGAGAGQGGKVLPPRVRYDDESDEDDANEELYSM